VTRQAGDSLSVRAGYLQEPALANSVPNLAPAGSLNGWGFLLSGPRAEIMRR